MHVPSAHVSRIGLSLATAAIALVGVAHPSGAVPARPPAESDGPVRLLGADENDVVIRVDELPQSVRDYITKEMPGGKITEARKDYKGNKEKKGSNFTFEVDVKQGAKEYELRFSNDGKFLRKRENVGDEPDGK